MIWGVDATEQETEKRDWSWYSGKKKKHTIKTQTVSDGKWKIKHISKTVPWNIHDKKLFDNTKLKIDKNLNTLHSSMKNLKIIWDLWYIGTKCNVPFKKKRNKQLTIAEKEHNKSFSKRRIIIEHTFAHLKKFNILKDKFRNSIKNYNKIFAIIACLYNLKF